MGGDSRSGDYAGRKANSSSVTNNGERRSKLSATHKKLKDVRLTADEEKSSSDSSDDSFATKDVERVGSSTRQKKGLPSILPPKKKPNELSKIAGDAVDKSNPSPPWKRIKSASHAQKSISVKPNTSSINHKTALFSTKPTFSLKKSASQSSSTSTKTPPSGKQSVKASLNFLGKVIDLTKPIRPKNPAVKSALAIKKEAAIQKKNPCLETMNVTMPIKSTTTIQKKNPTVIKTPIEKKIPVEKKKTPVGKKVTPTEKEAIKKKTPVEKKVTPNENEAIKKKTPVEKKVTPNEKKVTPNEKEATKQETSPEEKEPIKDSSTPIGPHTNSQEEAVGGTLMRMLAVAGMNLTSRDPKTGLTAFTVACRTGNLGLVKSLFKDTSPKLNMRDNHGASALLLALQKGHWHVARFLVDRGADVNLQDKQGWSALMLASRKGELDMVKVLVAAGARLDALHQGQSSAEMMARKEGHVEVADFLVKAGAKVPSRPKPPTAPLKGSLLLDYQNGGGWTALMSSSEEGKIDLVKALLARGAKLDLVNRQGQTALMLASAKGHLKVVRALHLAGADVQLKDLDGQSALTLAGHKGFAEVVGLLKGALAQKRKEDQVLAKELARQVKAKELARQVKAKELARQVKAKELARQVKAKEENAKKKAQEMAAQEEEKKRAFKKACLTARKTAKKVPSVVNSSGTLDDPIEL